MDDVKKYLSKFLAEELTKALKPSPSDFIELINSLLEIADRFVIKLLELKDNKQRAQLLRKFGQHCRYVKESLQQEGLGRSLSDIFLRDSYTYIDGCREYVISSSDRKERDSKKYGDLQCLRDNISNRGIVQKRDMFNDYIQEQIDQEEKEKQLTRELDAAIEYITLDVATRTITIGTGLFTITSEQVWDFVRDLVLAKKTDQLVPVLDGTQNNKNNVDQLRRKVGKDNLKKLVVSTGDGYKLSPAVKVLNSGQVAIRKTDRKRLRAT